jgi:plastocyanin
MRNDRSSPPALILLAVLSLLHAGLHTSIAQPRPIADIHGTVTLTRKTEPDRHPVGIAERYPGHGSSEVPAGGAAEKPYDMRLSERCVVYLESDLLNRGKYVPPDKNPILDQKGLQFHPQVLPILVGTTVDFPNRDNLFHNVFSYSQPKEFDLGRYPKDDSRSVRFDRPGTVRVYCDIHAHMHATIVVLAHPYFATPGDDGTYAIRNVPEGRYSLVLWVDRNIVERRSIEVRAGETLTVDFTE